MSKENQFKTVHFKIDVQQLFNEILENKGSHILHRPLQVLQRKLLIIASVANEKGYEDIVKVCDELGLYKERKLWVVLKYATLVDTSADECIVLLKDAGLEL